MLYIHEGGPVPPLVVNNLRLQVDNSLELGWAAPELMIFTNFAFSHAGVDAIVIEPKPRPKTARLTSFHKTDCLLQALDRIGDLETLWYHDVDAYQLEPFDAPHFDGALAFCLYTTRERMITQGGSMFIRKRARPIFEAVMHKLTVEQYRKDEFALTDVMSDPRFLGEFHMLDFSYNVGDTDFAMRYQLAKQRPKVVHFHLDRPEHRATFIEGKNAFGARPLGDRFVALLQRHGMLDVPMKPKRHSLLGRIARTIDAAKARTTAK